MTKKLIQIQNILRFKKRIFYRDLEYISKDLKCRVDTLRRYLEKDRTPFAKKLTKQYTEYWDYVPELDVSGQLTLNI